MTAQGYRIAPGLYRDSVALMRLSALLLARPGVAQAAVVMGTPANCEALAESGLPAPPPAELRPDDLLLAVSGQSEEEVAAALAWAEAEVRRPPTVVARGTPAGELAPHTLADGLRLTAEANLVSIAVPGEYAAAEAFKALKAGRHVFLFSSGVPLADEARLKQLAAQRGLLLMGPECGTALIGGVPLGFANAVRRGSIGLVAASGSGLQEVMCLIHRWGGGISHAIGAGGRDLHQTVGGLTTLAGLQLLEADPNTEVIVLLSKPPALEIAARVLAQVAELTKPCVVAFLGLGPASVQAGGAQVVSSLEDAARAALAAAGLAAPPLPTNPTPKARPGRFVRGLFSGGTLCSEAAQMLAARLGPVAASVNGEAWPAAHLCLDLGDERYTRGRPHPMIDARLRAEKLGQAANDLLAGVVLFDIVLGYGASPDPVGPLLAAVRPGQVGPQYIAHVVGTTADPQNLETQEDRLRRAGVWVAPTNASAARMAIEAIGT